MYITSKLPICLNLIYVVVRTVSIYLKNFLMQNECRKISNTCSNDEFWDVNSNDWFTFNRFLYHLLLRFHLSSFLQLLPPRAFFHFFKSRITWGKPGCCQTLLPRSARAVQYFLGKTTERTQALGVTSGLDPHFCVCARLSQQRFWHPDEGTDCCFLVAFLPCSPDMMEISWRLLPQLQMLQLSKHSQVTHTLNHLVMLTSGRVRQ